MIKRVIESATIYILPASIYDRSAVAFTTADWVLLKERSKTIRKSTVIPWTWT